MQLLQSSKLEPLDKCSASLTYRLSRSLRQRVTSVTVFCSHLIPDVNTDVVAVKCFRLHPLFILTYKRLHVFLV